MAASDLKTSVMNTLLALQAQLVVKPDDFTALLIFNHGKQLAEHLAEILNNGDSLKQTLALFLKQNWQDYGMSALGYTAIPNAPTTRLMCEIACFLADKHTSAFSLLMPGVSIEPIDDTQYPELNTDKTAEQLINVLNSHILGRDGQYLIPISLLYKQKDLAAHLDKLPNIYFDYKRYQGSPDGGQSFTKLDAAEVARLQRHSTSTENVLDALSRYELLAQNDETLLGQLNHFVRHLKFNSENGTGSEELSGTNISMGSQAFFLFFEKLTPEQVESLPKALSDEIALIKAYMSGEKEYDIDSCFDTRAHALETAMRGHQALLNSIRLSSEAKDKAFDEAKEAFDSAKSALKAALESCGSEGAAYTGSDKLPLTPALLEKTDTELTVTDAEHAALLVNTLRVEDIPVLFNNEKTQGSFFSAISTFDLACYFVTDVPAQALRAILDAGNKDRFLDIFLKDEGEFINFLNILDKEKQSVLIETLVARHFAGHGYQLLRESVSAPSVLALMLEQIPESESLSAVKEKDVFGNTVLHLAADNPESIKLVLGVCPEDKRLEAVKEKDNSGNTVLHWAASNPESLKAILDLLPNIDRLEAVKEKNNYGNTVLHKAASNPESLKLVLGLYPEDKRLEAVKEKDRSGNTVLHEAADNPESLKVILDLLLNTDRLEAVKEKNAAGDAVLHWAVEKPESLKVILDVYPEDKRLEAVKEKDRSGYTVLHKAASNPESLNAILDLLPEGDRLKAVKEKDGSGYTVLHWATENPESLKLVLSVYSEDKLLEAIKEKSDYGITVLQRVVNKPESLKLVLGLLPEDDRLEAVKEKNSSSNNVLHLIAREPESLKLVLGLLPEDDRLEAVKEKNGSGNTLLHWAVNKPESLKAILLSLDKEGQFNLLKTGQEQAKLRDCLMQIDDEDLAGHPVLIIYRFLLLQQNTAPDSPTFWSAPKKRPKITHLLERHNDYQSFYAETVHLIQTSSRVSSDDLLEKLGIDSSISRQAKL